MSLEDMADNGMTTEPVAEPTKPKRGRPPGKKAVVADEALDMAVSGLIAAREYAALVGGVEAGITLLNALERIRED